MLMLFCFGGDVCDDFMDKDHSGATAASTFYPRWDLLKSQESVTALLTSPSFSNKINKNDAIKLMNDGENFGIIKDSQILSIETSLLVTQADTIFYGMHNLQQQGYRFIFIPKNTYFELNAFLIDRYLKTEKAISLSDSTIINFSITSDTASSIANRFMIVFRPSAKALAVSYISVNAYKQNANIMVE